MKPTTDNWIDFWKTENVISDEKWQKDMHIFIKATAPLLQYNPQDVVLDVGCGPGFLASFLKDKVKEVHCIDTSERYLDICRHRFIEDQNLFFYKLNEENYTDLSCLSGRQFSLVICLSVIQYYKSIDEVKSLIEEVRKVARPGARMLIADIMVQRGAFTDLMGVLMTAVRERHLIHTLKYFLTLKRSNYIQTRSSLGLLYLSVKELHDLAAEIGVRAEILSTPLTTNRNRKHMLITFSQ